MATANEASTQNKNQTSEETVMENVNTGVTVPAVECVEAEVVAEETTAVEELAVIKTDTHLLPIEKLNLNLEAYELNGEAKRMRAELIEDIKNAERHTILALFYYIKVGKRLISIKKTFHGQKGEYTKFLASIGIHERKAQRYSNIAADKRFATMSEEDMNQLHRFTQNQLEQLTKLKDEEFKKAIGDTNFQLPKKGGSNGGGKPTNCIIDDALYQTFMAKDKAYVINEYNTLLLKYNELEKKLSESVVIEADVIGTIDTAANMYTVDAKEVA
ncbi:MAG TPA: hypothetical protein PLM93_11135 [Sulfuricurvum sp.]|nr:MAG: hypothetical protein B7X89_12070 [Sulfuricurvum sp. 17-40-25]HQS67726.1 hypothetical protein [Sulfuricurvum sp.]